jgi:hypothetical protein
MLALEHGKPVLVEKAFTANAEEAEILIRKGDVSAAIDILRTDFSEEYKCYFIDRERNLVGIPVRSWHTGYYDYILLHFNGYDFHEVLRSRIDGDLEKTRAFMADGYLYIFSSGSSDQNFVVEQLR